MDQPVSTRGHKSRPPEFVYRHTKYFFIINQAEKLLAEKPQAILE